MSEIVETKVTSQGGKRVTSQVLSTPMGKLRISIGVRGYKSSEDGKIMEPPTETNEPEGAEEQAGRSQ